MSEQQSLMPAGSANVPAARPTEPTMLEIIREVALNPESDVEKVERLLAMQERIVADQRRIAFTEALARIQSTMPAIRKNGLIPYKGNVKIKYAKLEDIDKVIRPMMKDEGFSLSFDTERLEGGYQGTAKLSHTEGHSETYRLFIPWDHSQNRTAAQNAGSTLAYLRRLLIKMVFNIVEAGEDDDGSGKGTETISELQAHDIEMKLQECGKEARPRFFNWLRERHRVEAIADIPLACYESVVKKLETTRRSQ